MNAQTQTAELQEQVEMLKAVGISPENWLGMIDKIIYDDLSDKNFKKSGKPLAEAADKQKEINRIINNYSIALAITVEDKQSGKDNDARMITKFSTIASAAKAGLLALGIPSNDVNNMLGLTQALKDIKGGQ